MAIGVHVARVGVFNVDATGVVLKKDDPSISLRQQLTTSMDHRIIADSLIPSSVNNPAVKAYIEAEAASDYIVHYMDQNTIITYLRTAAGGFTS